MQLYVINLDRTPERMAHMAAQLSRLEVPYERLSAVDGRALDPTYVAKFPPMAATEIGCFLSHKVAWQRIVDGPGRYGIVLEDDIHIAPAFAKFALSTQWISTDAGIVKFETINRPVCLDKTPHATWHGSALRRLRTFHAGSAAYLLAKDTARLLLMTHAQLTEPADDAIFYVNEPWRRLPATYQLDPAICVQDQARSSGLKDPHLASLQELPRQPSKSPRHSAQRDVRRFYRWVAAEAAAAAAAVGAGKPFIQKVVPFVGQ